MQRVRTALILVLPALVLLAWFAFALRPRSISLPDIGSPLLQGAARQMVRAVQRAERRSWQRIKPYPPDSFAPDHLLTMMANARLVRAIKPDYSPLAAQFGTEPTYLQLVWEAVPIEQRQWMPEGFDERSADEALFALLDLPLLAERDPQEAERLARAAIALNPDNSCFHYQLAQTLFETGNHRGGFDSLRVGNAAPQNYLPSAFPASEIAGLDRAVLANADPRVQLVYAQLFSHTQVPFLLTERKMLTGLISEEAAALTESELNTLYAWSRRTASREAAGWLPQAVGLQNLRTVLEAALRESDRLGLDVARLETLRAAAESAGHPFSHVLARRNSNDDDSHAHFWREVEEELDACQALREAVLQLPELRE